MAVSKPFRIDPTQTAAFAALSDLQAPPNDDGGYIKPLRAVVVGGGTGAPISIRSLLSLGIETSAVVAMADDGGSTGILRDKANVTPPGDIRKCIAAMADDPFDPLVRAFKYRLAIADDHALGNLMLAALEDACGSFPKAIEICERLVNAQGHVYPSTLDHVTLSAVTCDGRVLDGQAVASHSTTALREVALNSEDGQIRAYRPAVYQILEADLIILGPGSLFTSIIANLLVPGILNAIKASSAPVLYVCSVADVQGETWGLSALEHIDALYRHGMEGLIDYVLIHTPVALRADSPQDTSFLAASGTDEHAPLHAAGEQYSNGARLVRVSYNDVVEIQNSGATVLARDLRDSEHPTWHSPAALRNAILQVVKLIQARNK